MSIVNRFLFLGLLLGLGIECQPKVHRGDISKSIQGNNLLREYSIVIYHIVGIDLEDHILIGDKEVSYREYLRECFKKGADANQIDDYGTTFLDLAVSQGDVETVKILCEYGVDVNRYDKNKCTPLSKAIKAAEACSPSRYMKLTEIVRIIIEYGADVNKVYGRNGFVPLHEACRYKSDEIVKILLSYGANPNVCDNYGRFPLFYAAHSYLNKDTVRLVTMLTTCINKVDSRGRTPFYGRQENISILREVLIERLERDLSSFCVNSLKTYFEENAYTGIEQFLEIDTDKLSQDRLLWYYARYGCANITVAEKVLNEALQNEKIYDWAINNLFIDAVYYKKFDIASLIRNKCNNVLISEQDEERRKRIEKAVAELEAEENQKMNKQF